MFSALFPVARHFFLLKVVDWSKSYKPESKSLLDVPSALNFFLRDTRYTLEVVEQRLREYVNLWNVTYSEAAEKQDKQTLFHLRTPFSDVIPISSHQFVERKAPGDKSEQVHSSELVLVLDNYHFVRDDFKYPKMPPCTVDDCSVSFKLSSTLFKPSAPQPEAASAADAAACQARQGEVAQYHFDKNGVSIPYPAFRQLLRDGSFVSYMEKVKNQYEKDLGVSVWSDDDDDKENKRPETNGRKEGTTKKKLDFSATQSVDCGDSDDSGRSCEDEGPEEEAGSGQAEAEKVRPKKKDSKKQKKKE